jgi:Rhodopirellula transposase DDE domain
MDIQAISQRFEKLAPFLNERTRRLLAAAEAQSLGHGGITAVAKATGVSRSAITRGIKELAQNSAERETLPEEGIPPVGLLPGAIRRPGGGRKPATETDPTLLTDLESLVEPVTRGDPESPLRWTCKSLRVLAAQLCKQGHRVSHQLVADLLEALGYSLQANQKTKEGTADHPDRNAQFDYINQQVKTAQANGQPAISVDTKKKELIGDFKNGGRELRPKGDPERVRVHDFVIEALGKIAPYGIYDPTHNLGWVNVGTDHDTAAFAVESIRQWWQTMGSALYPEAHSLLIMADGGGSNGYRVRLWKTQLQTLADATGLSVTVCHFPPGTSKWNKIEHRLFSFITQNWRGKPLVSHEVVIQLIAATTTRTGLRVEAHLDLNRYEAGIKVTDAEFAQVNLQRHEFHGEWNYTIAPTNLRNDTFIS